MWAKTRGRRFGMLAMLALALGVLTAPLAEAGPEPYLGWDFGRGVGIGIGTPPSAYDPCPTYGWPAYPHPCRYSYYRRARHYRYHHRY
jgi:hypothetical protein